MLGVAYGYGGLTVLGDIFFALWFFLPAGIANAVPVFAAHIPWVRDFSVPMDFGKKYRGKRILGSHKTWRGMIAGIIGATITLWVQQYMVAHSAWLAGQTAAVDYASINLLVVGPLFAIGALGGDALKSFFKRRRGIAPGDSWFPFDQLDYIIGGLLVTLPFFDLSLGQYLWVVAVWMFMHVASGYLAYRVGWKERPI